MSGAINVRALRGLDAGLGCEGEAFSRACFCLFVVPSPEHVKSFHRDAVMS